MGRQRGTTLIFVMPEDTRIAMARTARFGTRYLDWAADSPVYYTIPFAATPRVAATSRSSGRGCLLRSRRWIRSSVAASALMIWDYGDTAFQAELLRRGDLLIAAAGDDAINALEAQRGARPSTGLPVSSARP